MKTHHCALGHLDIVDQVFPPSRFLKLIFWKTLSPVLTASSHYGNTGCGVVKGEIQNKKGFWLKINCSQMELLNFENCSSGKLSKIGHHFRKQSSLKNFLDDVWRRKLTLKVKFWHFLISPHKVNSLNSIISFDYSWLLAKNLSNFVSLPWKLYNRYCHSSYIF